MKLNKSLSRYKQLKRLDSLGLNGKNILKVLTDYKKMTKKQLLKK